MKRNFFIAILLVAFTLISTNVFAAFTAGMSQQAKNDALTAAYITGSPVLKLALGLQSANTSVTPETTDYSSFTDLGTGHGYTTGGTTLSTCSVASTAGSSPLAADFTCVGSTADAAAIKWIATDSTGITADCAVLYNSTTGKIMALYTFTSATASGNTATFTITPPTIAAGTRGMLYIQ